MNPLAERQPIPYDIALRYLIDWMRRPTNPGFGSYGYEVYLPNVMRAYLEDFEPNPGQRPSEMRMRGISPSFYEAAWELCRRGVLRPGIVRYGAQATDDGASGNGYSLTPFGRTWIAEADRDDFVPTEPERFGKLLEPFQPRFGPGFASRAQEAVRCYGAHAYLACCTMVGAATESVLLAAAIAKKGNPEEVLKLYAGAMGRSRVENLLVGQAPEKLQREVRSFTGLLNYWRDDAAHGKVSEIGEVQALTALAMLLKFALVVNENWVALTSTR